MNNKVWLGEVCLFIKIHPNRYTFSAKGVWDERWWFLSERYAVTTGAHGEAVPAWAFAIEKTACFVRRGGLCKSRMCRSVGGYDVDTCAVFVEQHATSAEGEQGVVLAHAYVRASGPASAALTNDDVTSNYGLAAEFFHAEALAA